MDLVCIIIKCAAILIMWNKEQDLKAMTEDNSTFQSVPHKAMVSLPKKHIEHDYGCFMVLIYPF